MTLTLQFALNQLKGACCHLAQYKDYRPDDSRKAAETLVHKLADLHTSIQSACYSRKRIRPSAEHWQADAQAVTNAVAQLTERTDYNTDASAPETK